MNAAFLSLGSLALAVAARLPAAECPKCKPDHVCAPHAEADQKGIAERRANLKSKDLGERIAAVEAIAALTRAHENAPGRPVAEALAIGLRDDDFAVRTRAAQALVDGQHPDEAVRALIEALDDVREAFARVGRDRDRSRKEGEQERQVLSEKGREYVDAVIRGLGKLPDDRCVDALADQIKQLNPNAPSEFVVPLAQALAELRSREALRAIVSRMVAGEGTATRARSGGAGKGGGAGGGAGGGSGGGAGGGGSGGGGNRPGRRDRDGYREQGASKEQRRALHDALADVASSKSLKDAPTFDERAAQAWKDWLDDHENAFPAKLGRVGSTPVRPAAPAAKGG